MTARDAPIATLDPRGKTRALVDQPRLAAEQGPRNVPRVTSEAATREFADLRPDAAPPEAEAAETPQVVEDALPGVVMFRRSARLGAGQVGHRHCDLREGSGTW